MKASIKFYCPECKKTPPIDKAKSNKNWSILPGKCPTCKVQLKIKVL